MMLKWESACQVHSPAQEKTAFLHFTSTVSLLTLAMASKTMFLEVRSPEHFWIHCSAFGTRHIPGLINRNGGLCDMTMCLLRHGESCLPQHITLVGTDSHNSFPQAGPFAMICVINLHPLPQVVTTLILICEMRKWGSRASLWLAQDYTASSWQSWIQTLSLCDFRGSTLSHFSIVTGWCFSNLLTHSKKERRGGKEKEERKLLGIYL